MTIVEPSLLRALDEESTLELNDGIAEMVGRIEASRAIPANGVSGAIWSSLALLKAVEEAVSP